MHDENLIHESRESLYESTQEGAIHANSIVFNDMKRILMDRISCSVTFIHSYNDHQLNMSNDSSKIIGTFDLHIVSNH